MNPSSHKLTIQVFDENRITRDDFLGMIELTLRNIPKERPNQAVEKKIYYLQPKRLVRAVRLSVPGGNRFRLTSNFCLLFPPRSSRSKVKGYLEIYHAYVHEDNESDDEAEEETANGSSQPDEEWEVVTNGQGVHTASEASAPNAPLESSTQPNNVRIGFSSFFFVLFLIIGFVTSFRRSRIGNPV